jgi:hypothetical protein
VDNPGNRFYLSQLLPVPPVEEIVDNPRFLVDKLWISAELSTASTYPQFYPQSYPQVLPLLSTGLSTGKYAWYSCGPHRTRNLSTKNGTYPQVLWITRAICGQFGVGYPQANLELVDRVWTKGRRRSRYLLQGSCPGGRGFSACSSRGS